jgi:hypothetical protein
MNWPGSKVNHINADYTMKHFVILLTSLTALMLTITGQTGIQLNDPTKIQGHWCWGLEDTKVIIQMEQTIIQQDSDLVDCRAENDLLQAIIDQHEKDIKNLEQQITDAMLLYNMEQEKNGILKETEQSLIMDKYELEIKNNKLKKSRDGWITFGIVGISVGAVITTIVIAVQ